MEKSEGELCPNQEKKLENRREGKRREMKIKSILKPKQWDEEDWTRITGNNPAKTNEISTEASSSNRVILGTKAILDRETANK